MKKLLFCLLLTLLVLPASAQDLDSLIISFSKTPDVEYMPVDSETLKAQKENAGGQNVRELIDKFERVDVLDLEKCPEDAKAQFREKMSQLDKSVYIPLVNVKNSDGKVSIIQKKLANGITTDFIVYISENPMLVRIKGSFEESDINELIKNSNFD